jgi:2-polyprenyl-3-methyl-5-hydroxy-6-metoxy-1,4-benzoquinol methylase
MQQIINKTMDLNDLKSPEALEIVDELNSLIRELKRDKLKISSWFGSFDLAGDPQSAEWINRGYDYVAIKDAVDDRNIPWFLYWEIVWIVVNNNFQPGQTLLDLGGSSSLFSYYLASKDLKVTTVDLQKNLVENANFVAGEMGWTLRNYVMDMKRLELSSRFDHICSVCVYEHIPLYDRIEINKEINDLLVAGGTFCITFDYRNPSSFARINSPQDVYEQFVKPSNLTVRGNPTFCDSGPNYLLHPFYCKRGFFGWRNSFNYKIHAITRRDFSPREFFRTKDSNDYTFGALFLSK